ncbi:MAG: hypothetical protein IPG96_16755 [Proteobacteria bacterium]|nr:hypothetical protein [Pseudomonadota bacterium]
MARDVFQEMVDYIGFDAADGELLREFAPHARPHFTRISNEFYGHLARFPEAAKVFDGPEQIQRLKHTLVDWLELLLTGPWDTAYAEKRLRIGAVHVRIGLPQRYMFGAMAIIRSSLSALAGRVPVSEDHRRAMLRAIDLVLDLELAIMLESYATAHEGQVRQMERLRSEKLSALGTMAAGLAHEIRNPLNAAHLQLALVLRRLQRKGAVDVDGAVDAAQIVSSEMQRLAGLVEEFLHFARPQPLQRAKTELRGLVGEVIALLGHHAEESGVSIVLEPGPPVYANVDVGRLKQVLHNLVRNATEAVPRDGHVWVRVSDDDGQASLEVEDDGPGLPGDAAIFEPFFTTKPGGTGLGLAIVHRIVTDHGGQVSAQSTAERTIFRVVLPMRGPEGRR